MAVDPLSLFSGKLFDRALDPMDRISEVLFSLIMALTFTCALDVVSAGKIEVRTMLFGVLGCNLSWGIIDGVLFLMARFNGRARNIMKLQALRKAVDIEAAHRLIAEAMPPLLASVLQPGQLELMRQKLVQLPDPGRPRLTRHDAVGAIGIFLLCFLSTFPIVVPFILVSNARLALRISNLVACAMLLVCGYSFGHYSGFRPWAMGLAMVGGGGALIGVAVLLGG
jgi:VIT1/CCC1 family predicted Fe2+/Mn2+ transporter